MVLVTSFFLENNRDLTWLLASVSVGFVYGWVGHWLCAIEKKNVQLIWNQDVEVIGGCVLADVDGSVF